MGVVLGSIEGPDIRSLRAQVQKRLKGTLLESERPKHSALGPFG